VKIKPVAKRASSEWTIAATLKIHPGKNVKQGSDDTLLALIAGIVKFQTKKRKRFDGKLKTTKYINIVPATSK